MWRLLQFVLATSLVCAQMLYPPTRWFIPPQSDKLTVQEEAALLAAACDGTVTGRACDTCPESDEKGGEWSIGNIRLGHFVSPASRDAFIATRGCAMLAANGGGGMLLTSRSGHWERLDYMVGLETGRCKSLRFRSGRDLLVCEAESSSTDFLEHSLFAVFADGDQIGFKSLFTAGDTTCSCYAGRKVQKAVLEKLEFHDAKSEGQQTLSQQTLSIDALYGTLTLSTRQAAQCQAAWDAYVQDSGKRTAGLP